MSMFRSALSKTSSIPRLGSKFTSPISKLGRRSSGHQANTAENWGPWSPAAYRSPKTTLAVFYGTMLFWFCAPFAVMSYQLNKQNKHLGWYPAEWEKADE